MRTGLFCFVPMAFLLGIIAVDSSFAQDPVPGGPGPRRMSSPAEESVFFPPQPPPDFALRVDVDKTLMPKARLKSHQQVADFLGKAQIGVPDDRVAYFKTIIAPNTEPVVGWRGSIVKITPTDEGVVVSLRVHARRGRVLDFAHIIEHYSIVNGQVNYVGSFVPPNQNRIIMLQ